jgi:flagellin
MAAVLGTNVASLWASSNLQGAQQKLATSVERLSSGLRINRARDDAAGLGISNTLTSQINGANQGIRNLNDGISMIQTAEAAISTASEMGQRILSLATQGANSTLGSTARAAIKSEMQQLITSINSISTRTSFSGNDLLNEAAGSNSTKFTLQATNSATDTVSLNAEAFVSIGVASSYTYTALGSANLLKAESTAAGSPATVYTLSGGVYTAREFEYVSASAYTLDGVVFDTDNFATVYKQSVAAGEEGHADALNTQINVADITDETDFNTIIGLAETYIEDLDSQRSLLGAYQNQLDFTVTNITALSANLSSARSTMIDTDYSQETASLTKGQILQQAATAMLAQANQMPNVILSLLK